LAKEQKLNYGDDITSVLRQARKRRFQVREEQRIAQDIDLQTYLNQLIVDDAKRNLAALQEQETTKDSDTDANSTEFARRKEEIEEKRDTCISRLNDLFAKVDERRRVCFLSISAIKTRVFVFIFLMFCAVIYKRIVCRKERCPTICVAKSALRSCKSQ